MPSFLNFRNSSNSREDKIVRSCSAPLLRLPNELLSEVFSYLSLGELAVVSQVNRRMHHVTENMSTESQAKALGITSFSIETPYRKSRVKKAIARFLIADPERLRVGALQQYEQLVRREDLVARYITQAIDLGKNKQQLNEALAHTLGAFGSQRQEGGAPQEEEDLPLKVCCLLYAGAEVNTSDSASNSLSRALAGRASEEVISMLFKKGVKPSNAQDLSNALSWAVDSLYSEKMADTLLKMGAQPSNAQDLSNTLSCAVENRRSNALIRKLLGAGALPSRARDFSNTIMLAKRQNATPETLQLLACHGRRDASTCVLS